MLEMSFQTTLVETITRDHTEVTLSSEDRNASMVKREIKMSLVWFSSEAMRCALAIGQCTFVHNNVSQMRHAMG